jgi:sugar/nucleoside kinase (ribokinase family)
MTVMDSALMAVEPYSLVLSHVVLDEIWRPGASQPVEVLGGAGAHAALGQALAYAGSGRSTVISGVGADFPPTTRRDLNAAGVDDTGLVAMGAETPRTVITYSNDDTRVETPTFGRAHFERCDPSPDMVPRARTAPEAVYIFAGLYEPAWSVLDQLTSAPGVLWELDASICRPEHTDAIRERSNGVAVVSMNEQELAGLTGGRAVSTLRAAMKEIFPTVEAVALRRGWRGAVIATQEGWWSARPDATTTVSDPTGAGNAFSGALAVEWVRSSGDVARSLRAAMAAAAVTISRPGPVLPLTPLVLSEFAEIANRQPIHHLSWKDAEI